MFSVSRSCSDLWKIVVVSLEFPPIVSVYGSGQGSGQVQTQSQKKRRVIGIVLRKFAAQSQTTSGEPSFGELEGFFTFVRLEKSQDRIAEAEILQRRGKFLSLGGWSVRKSQPTFFGKRDGAEKCLELYSCGRCAK